MTLSQEAWQASAVQGVVDVLDTYSLTVDGTVWGVDATDADDDPAAPGEVYLTTEDGRQITVQLWVVLVEGDPVMRASGAVGTVVAARAGIELPDPAGSVLVILTWTPAPSAPDHHSPNCRARCCGSWHLSLPVPASAPRDWHGSCAGPVARPTVAAGRTGGAR